jgi:glycine oxidase
MRAWPEWAAALEKQSETSPEFWTCGMDVMLEDVNAALDWCQANQFPAEAKPGRVWLPGVSQVRNPRLLAAMKEAVITLGGKVLANCEVKGFKTGKGRIPTAHTTQGEQHADLFVLAAGAWSGLPLNDVLPAPNIRPMRGQMLLYPPGSHTLEHIILKDGFYLVPRKDGHLLAGSTIEDAGFDTSTTPEALNTLHQNACHLLPSLQGHSPIKSWAGLRPGSPDNLPVIGRHPDFENLWIHTGHFRYGVTMVPASSRLLVELMTGTTPFLDPAPYSWQASLQRNWQEKAAC